MKIENFLGFQSADFCGLVHNYAYHCAVRRLEVLNALVLGAIRHLVNSNLPEA